MVVAFFCSNNKAVSLSLLMVVLITTSSNFAELGPIDTFKVTVSSATIVVDIS